MCRFTTDNSFHFSLHFLGCIPLGSLDHTVKQQQQQSDMCEKHQSNIHQKNEKCIHLSTEIIRKQMHKIILDNALDIMWVPPKYDSCSF